VEDVAAVETRSLVNDLEDLLVDARTWADAEFTYQKTRAGFVAGSLRNALVLGLSAAVLGLVLLITVSIGSTIALMPILGPWGATGLVGLVLALVIVLLLRAAARNWRDITAAIRENREGEG